MLDVLEQRFGATLRALSPKERDRLTEMLPKLGEYSPGGSEKKASCGWGCKIVSRFSPRPKPRKSEEDRWTASDLQKLWWAILDSNQ